MKEKLLAFIWKLQLFVEPKLCSTDGESLEVIHPGFENFNAGPDFLEANLSFIYEKWFGSVEIHVKGSDWYKHGHHLDPAYDNVILHVVYENDKQVFRNNGLPIKTLEIGRFVSNQTIEVYKLLMGNEDWIPCFPFTSNVPSFYWTMMLEDKGVERMVYKARRALARIEEIKGDWEQLAYETIMRSFGFGVNSEGFEILSKKTPISILRRECGDELNQEALLFGMSNCIERHPVESLRKKLKVRFEFLKYKYELVPLKKGVMRFLRTRPSNFPSHRLLQVHKILLRQPHLFETMSVIGSSTKLKDWLPDDVIISKRMKDLIMINAIIPLRMAWHLRHGEAMVSQGLIDDLSDTKAEDNKLIRQWRLCGIKAVNAVQSQGMKQLYEHYCRRKRCIECKVGTFLMTKDFKLEKLE